MRRAPLALRAALLSLLLFAAFVAIWHLATLPKGGRAAMDPEYAKLMGAGATQGKSAMPTPADVGAAIAGHLADPFFDRGPNTKGIGIQLGYSIGRVLIGFALAVIVGVPLGFVIHHATRRHYSSSSHEGLSLCAQYWHFLGGVWLVLVTMLYLGN